MTDVEKYIEHLASQVKWEIYPQRLTGGQHVGVMPTGCTLTCDTLDFSITIAFYRSQLKNRELALTLFKLYASEVIKP